MTFQAFARAAVQSPPDISFDPLRYGLNDATAFAIQNAAVDQTFDAIDDPKGITGFAMEAISHWPGSNGPDAEAIDLTTGASVTAAEPYQGDASFLPTGTSIRFELKELAGSLNMRLFARQAQANQVAQLQVQRVAKWKAIRALAGWMFFNGDNNLNPEQFDGLDRFVTLGIGRNVVPATTALLDHLSELTEANQTGNRNRSRMSLLMNSDSLRKLMYLSRTSSNDRGFCIDCASGRMFFNGIRIYISDHIASSGMPLVSRVYCLDRDQVGMFVNAQNPDVEFPDVQEVDATSIVQFGRWMIAAYSFTGLGLASLEWDVTIP